jgi:hypothetical protein
LCADDHAYLKLQSLVKRAGVDGKDPTPGQVKKVYNPIFQAFLQTAGDKASKPILETCVTLIALSTAVVLAGSGDLDTLTILRILRSKIDETTYGTHMGKLVMPNIDTSNSDCLCFHIRYWHGYRIPFSWSR